MVTRAQIRQPPLHFAERHLFQLITQARFEPREAELQVVAPPPEPARKVIGCRVTLSREFFDQRPTRITQPEQLRAFVEGFARGIIASRREHPQSPLLIKLDQERVPAGNHESQMRQEFAELLIELAQAPRMQRDKWRKRMRPQVIHAPDRHAQRQPEGLRRRQPDREARRQARPLRHRHRIDLRKLGTLPRGLNQRRKMPQMLARRQIRHHSAMSLVQGHLRVHPLGHNPALGRKKRDRRLIT